jgi:transcription elongation factor/antiterminator RfaH
VVQPSSTTALDDEQQCGARWYAVHCLSHRETAAAAHLRNQTYPVFLPLRRKTRRHARRIESVTVPFFPGYLFVSLDLSRDRWRSVNGTHGVASLVMQGELPMPVPPGVVENLQASSDPTGVISWQPELKPDQRVRIAEGAFVDLVGTFERLDGPERVRVLLDIMGGRYSAVVPRASVVPAGSTA